MSDEFKELLLQDYKYRAEAMGKSETAGETRVNLFIGLITLSSGGIGALISKGDKGEILQLIILAAFASLFVVGIVTLLRMIVRNKNTDQCKHQLDLIRQTYQDHFDGDGSWVLYDLFPRRKKEKKRKGPQANESLGNDADETKAKKKDGGGDEEAPQRVRARDFGGLAHTVAVLNSLLFAGAVAALLFPPLKGCVLALAGIPTLAFAAALSLQNLYLRHKEAEWKEEMRHDFPVDTRAGGVVYKIENKVALYLLVTSKIPTEDESASLLPKGHIEPGEGQAEAALREVREETGIVARLGGPLGRIQFVLTKKVEKAGKVVEIKESVSVKFYLMEILCETVSTDKKRRKAWMTFEAALDALPCESKQMLRKAEQRRLRALHTPAPDADVAKG